MRPTVGRVVHYVSVGGGPYPSACRAAIVTEVTGLDDDERVGLAVLNPTGIHFRELPADLESKGGVGHDEQQAPGTWHWPERSE